MAQWLFVHGNEGGVQDPEQTASMRTGGGWRVSPTKYGDHWVHFAVPTFSENNWRVDRIRLTFFIKGPTTVSKIELFDGRIGFWSKDVEFEKYDGALYDEELDLGQEWLLYRGLGISIKLTSIIDHNPSLVIFHSVGAHFTK